MISEKFSEIKRTKGDNSTETNLVEKYINRVRVEKIVDKIEDEAGTDLGLSDTPRVVSTVFHDFITEECWEFAKSGLKVDFKVLKTVAGKKIVRIFKDLYEEELEEECERFD
jgi:hypothetical protein